MRENVLFLLLICTFLCLGIAQNSEDYHAFYEGCKYEELPDTLNSISYLDFNDELHIHDEFFINTRVFEKIINFTIRQSSAFRLYTAPHEMDADLYLYAANGTQIAYSSLDIGTEEVISKTLLPGNYYTRFHFFGARVGVYQPTECDTLTVELQIAPVSVITQRTQNICPAQELLPVLDFSVLNTDQNHYYYSTSLNASTSQYNVRGPSSTSKYSVRWVQAYNFTVPASTSGKVWTMEVTLGTEFVFGDSLGLLLTGQNVSELDVSCYADAAGSCEAGINSRMNENTLKAAMEPGSYSLWIYDMTGEKDATLSACIPFSLTMKLETQSIDETFYNCDAPKLPDRLLPGYDQPAGFVHYLESPLLDLGEGVHTILFQVNESSLLRVYTQPHRVDIDLKLINNADGSVVEYVFRIGGEESIARLLSAGNYSLQIIYYGLYEPIFCETFDLEIAIAPYRFYADTSYCMVTGTSTVKNVAPDFSTMQAYLDAVNHTYYMNSSVTYYFDYQQSYSERNIVQQNFTLLSRSAVKAALGDSFLLADLQIEILDTSGRSIVNGSHARNFDRIEATLEPGSYIFVVSTSPVQKSIISGLPPCAEYTLYLGIQPDTSVSTCWQYWRMPGSLNTVPYLGHTNFIHFVGDYLVPTFSRGSVSATTRTNFTVTEPTFLRVWIEPHEVDIDINLYQDGVRVASTILVNVEEEIVFSVQPNRAYQIQYVYYKPRSYDSSKCYIFRSEIALALLPSSVAACGANRIPPSNLIPNYSPLPNTVGEPFYNSATYFYTQTATSFNVTLPFTVSQSVNFRSFVLYDFAWADLSVRIKSANGTGTIFGDDEYDKNELGPIELAPGSYVLEIYEPAAVSLPDYRGCVDFTLTVGYEGVEAEQLPEEFDCTAAFFPVSLNNNPAFLHAATGNKIHWRRNILANVETRKDYMDFAITQASILTIFVPAHSTLDIDFSLHNGTTAVPGPKIDNRDGLSEEAMYQVLSPGSYYLEWKYYAMSGSLPTAASCPTFPAEISIVPVSTYTTVSAVTQPCATNSVPPASLVRATDYGASFHRVPNAAFSTNMTFTVESKSSLLFDLRSQQQVGGLGLTMYGRVEVGGSTAQSRTYHASIGTNHAFLYYILEAGTYVVNIYDPYMHNSSVSAFQCSDYRVEYRLDYTNITDSSCENTDPLPTDLYTDNGGSDAFGGPQDVDGSVRIWGDDFKLDETHKHNYIDFMINQPSYLRVFAQSSEDADIDFYFYANTNRTGAFEYSLGIDSVESTILALNPQANPYSMDVYLYDLDSDQLCPTFEFEMAIKTQATVQSELQCPVVMPSPEVPPAFYNLATDVDIASEYIFTKDRIQSNTVAEVFTYRMTLSVPFNGTTVMSSIGYDFLANDFRLKISSSDGSLQEWGSLGGIQNRDDYYNFYSMLYITLPTGTFYLDIVEDLDDKPFNFTSYCHKFDFVLSTFSGHNVTNQPYIQAVVPAGGDSTYDPYRDLSLRVTFSESVVLPAGITVLNYTISNNAAYMYPVNNASNRIYPGSASFSNSNTRLSVVFRKPFLVGQRYIFVVDGTKFTGSSGLTFLSPTQDLSYQMRTCDCNGHGTCNTSATTQLTCSCDTGYSSLDCSQCATGFHGVGTVCVANTKCTDSTCNGHGRCYDSSGSPTCVCNTGYATVGDNLCGTCAPDYIGYPNCTISDANERNTVCSAPLFPPSLDTIEFLGYDGEVHMRDSYYIDLDNYRTEIYFSLQQNSVFRVYVEPHWIDIDLWLYALKDDGSIDRYIDNEVAYNTEEVIYQTLSGQSGDHPKKYMLRLRYFIWDRTRSPDCEAVNFELAIEPVSKAQLDPNQKNCGPVSILPPNSNSTAIQISNDFRSVYNAVYNVHNTNSTVEGPNYFYIWNFNIAPPKGKSAILHAEVAYRFLTGDLALLLEVGDSRTHCGNSGGYSSDCVQGSNGYNLNTLDEILMEGDYSLWIYEPQPQLPVSNCSSFTFNISVTFVDMINDLYYCEAVTLPASFNEAGYLDNTGNMHVFNNYLIQDSDVSFTLTRSSYIRVAGDSDNSVRFALYKGTTLVTQSALSIAPELFASLTSGTYTLKMIAFQVSEDSCPIIATQMTITPQGSVPHSCPQTELLPSIFPAGWSLPYEFEQTSNSNPQLTPFYAFTNTLVVKTTTFTLSETAFFDAYLSSDFLTSNLKISLQFSGSSGEVINVNGSLGYNQYWIKQMLQAGTYTLSIYRTTTSNAAGFPPCAEFNLQISLKSQSDYNANPCVAEGEPLPTSLNSIRFLGHDGVFDFQQTQIRAPKFNTYTQQVVKFSVTTPSVIRVYSEPHILDVDLILYAEGNSTSLTDGGLGFNNEESIIYQLTPGINYELTLNLWMWESNPPACLYFNLEIAVSPLSLVSLASTCPHSGSDHWPPLTAVTTVVTMPNSFTYDSAAEALYFQQTTTGTRSSPPMEFRILGDDKANLYAEVGYDYISGDLVLKMVHKETGDVYYGANTFNGNILSVTNLATGNYTMTIYEVVETLPVIMGCSNFTFQVYIEVASQESMIGPYPRLPASLDTISYLNYDGSVYLQGIYRMFETTSTETISFTIKQSSLLRIATDHQINELDDIQIIILQGGNVYAAGMETLLEMLPPNTYQIQLNKPNGPHVSYLDVSFELAVKTDTQVNAFIAAQPTTCTTTKIPEIALTPDGYYSEAYTDLIYTNGDMASLTDLQTLKFTVNQESVVYFKLGFDYLLSDLSLNLTSFDNTHIQPIPGRNGRNMNDINAVIPAGTWVLRVYQPTAFVYSNQYSHCTHYTATLSVESSSEINDHVDCTTLDVLPWDLNSPTGGSSAYGGPVNRDGILQMWGSNFYIHHDVDVMYITPVVDSLLNIITKEKFSGEITYTVKTNTSVSLIATSVLGMSNSNQKTSLYELTGKLTYMIMLDYPSVARTNCPALGLQISMQPTSVVSSTLVCPSTTVLPTATPVITSGTYNEYLDGSFSRSDLTHNTDSSGNFYYMVNFTIASPPSKVYASIAFNGLSSLFSLSLVRWSGTNRVELARSEANFQREATGDNTVTQYLTGSITTTGTYSLIIMQPAFSAPFMNGTLYCVPYQYELVIVPDTGFPWVRSVAPYSADGVDPTKGLVLQLEMSEAPYTRGGAPATTADFSTAFALTPNNIRPTSVVADGGSPLYWTLTFSSLLPTTTYKLTIIDSAVLLNKNGSAFSLQTSNYYKTLDTSCSGHGTFSSESGECFCQSGYGGPSCDGCMPNFQPVTVDGKLVCKQKTGELCLIDSCGCEPHFEQCIPLGKCDDSTGKIQCSCPIHYDPATNCATCSPGYTNYDNGCTDTERTCPTCVHGRCDNATKTCICDGNYSPPTCSACLDGWEGSTCQEKVSSSSNNYDGALEAVRIVEIILACLTLLGTGGFLLYRRFGPRGYQQVEMEFNAIEQDQESPFELDE